MPIDSFQVRPSRVWLAESMRTSAGPFLSGDVKIERYRIAIPSR